MANDLTLRVVIPRGRNDTEGNRYGGSVITTQSVAGEGKEEGAVQLHPHLDPLQSRERTQSRARSSKAGVSWPVSLSLITNQASIC